MIATIQARRDALAAQLAEAQQQYDTLEQALRQLDRQLCAMHGGLQELDALIAADATGLIRESQAAPALSGDPIGDGAARGAAGAIRLRAGCFSPYATAYPSPVG